MNIRIRFMSGITALAALCLAAFSGQAQAQGATITGKVVSEQGNPLLGANATIADLGVSVGSNVAGIYTITIPGAQVRGQTVTLRVRAIGFVPQQRQVVIRAGTQTIDLTLRNDVNKLSQVVVTGVTGATEATKVPFATNTVNAADLIVPATNPLSQIVGKVPGANIVSASGRPGAQPAVLLRGPTAISAAGRGQDPLYIVDGVILNGPLPTINPQDIESVEVVKGAAAASLYGARAGNGVIQITTKSGKGLGGSDGVRFSYRGEYGVGDIERRFGLAQRHGLYLNETQDRFCQSGSIGAGTTTPSLAIDCVQTINYQSEVYRINDQGGDFALPPPTFTLDPSSAVAGSRIRNRFQTEKWPGATYDAVDQFAQPQPFYINNLDMTGRYGRTSFYASLNALNQGGSIRYLQGYRRNSIRANIDHGVGSDWNFAIRAYYARSFEDGNNFEDGGDAVFFRLTRVPPISNLLRTDSKGRLFIRNNLQGSGQQNFNPLYYLQAIQNSVDTDRFIAGTSARYTPASWLDVEGNFSYDNTGQSQKYFYDKGFRSTVASPANTGGVQRNYSASQAYNASLNTTLRKDFGATLRTRLNVRTLYEQQDGLGYNLSGTTLGATSVTTPGNVTDQTSITIGGSETSVRQISYFAGLNVEWKDRYIVDALIRRDGSSLFGEGNRWANFGRVSLAWRISQEPWMKIKGVSEFKLRASYGTAGGRPRFNAQYETFAVSSSGIQFGALGNRLLAPETIGETEIGFDAEFFNRVGVNFTYSQSDAENQILQVPSPAITGFQNQWRNAGTLRNETYELAVNVPIFTGRDLSWQVRGVFDRNRATITKLGPPPFDFGPNAQGATTLFRAVQGRPYAEIYGRTFLSSCMQLPTSGVPGTLGASTNFQSECLAGRMFGKNDEGYLVYTGNTAASPTDLGSGITANRWNTGLTGTWAPWGAPLTFGHPIVLRDNSGGGVVGPIGSALPDYRWALSTNLQFRKLTAYVLVDATMGRAIYNNGRGWAQLDFLAIDGDQVGKSVQSAKPMSYYYRAGPPDNGNGMGGFYDILGANTRVTENTNFAKVREVSLSYRVGRVQGLFGDWNVSMIGRNLYTFTNYRGFDPEVGFATGTAGNNAGSAAINAVDAFTFPNTRTLTFSIGTTF